LSITRFQLKKKRAETETEISATAHKNVASAIVDNGECNGYNKNRQKELLYMMFFCVLCRDSKND
jgi:hypothetical protein